jgi:5'-methylthioadenosine phosphorylase
MKLAHIGGSGTWTIDFPDDLEDPGVTVTDRQVIDTPFGMSAPICTISVDGRQVLHVPFHGYHSDDRVRDAHSLFWAFREVGVGAVVVDASVGSVNRLLEPEDIVIPHDAIDMRVHRAAWADGFITNGALRMSDPFDPDLSRILADAAAAVFPRVFRRGISLCVEGPRWETPAETNLYRTWGTDIVGHTLFPEIELAMAIGARFAVLNVVSNYGEGGSPADEVNEGETAAGTETSLDIEARYRSIGPRMGRVIVDAIRRVPDELWVPREAPIFDFSSLMKSG